MRRSLGFGLLAALLFSMPAAAQSLFATRGLGVPVPPQDARAMGLGGIGVGLLGLNPSMVNPAELAGIRLRGIVAAVQPSARSIDFRGEEADVGGTRFPLARILYPVNERLVVGLGYGGFLDQSWAVSTTAPAVIAGDTLEMRDVLRSDGGLAQLQLSAAYSFSEAFAVGAAGGLYTGGSTISITRRFADAELAGLMDFQTRREWSYGAPLAVVGLRWDPVSTARIGASLTWSGELEANVEAERDGAQTLTAERRIQLPLHASVGASALLTSRVLAAVGARWAGWSAADDDLAAADAGLFPEIGAASARDTWDAAAGLEWAGARAGSRLFPIRLSARYAQLPFPLRQGGEAPTEWAVALGLGARLAGNEEVPLAVADAAIERGTRSGAEGDDLTEEFWRLTISIAVFGR